MATATYLPLRTLSAKLAQASADVKAIQAIVIAAERARKTLHNRQDDGTSVWSVLTGAYVEINAYVDTLQAMLVDEILSLTVGAPFETSPAWFEWFYSVDIDVNDVASAGHAKITCNVDGTWQGGYLPFQVNLAAGDKIEIYNCGDSSKNGTYTILDIAVNFLSLHLTEVLPGADTTGDTTIEFCKVFDAVL